MRFWELPENDPWQREIPPVAALAGFLLPLGAMQLPLPWLSELPVAPRILLSSLLALAAAGACLVYPARSSWRSCFSPDPGMEKPNGFSWVWKTLLLLESGTFLLHEFSRVMLTFFRIPFEPEQELLTVLKSLDGGSFAVMAAALILVVPCCEEMMFRRMLYGLLRQACSVRAAVILQAVIFAALHFSLIVFLPLAFFGIIQEAVYLKSRRLAVPVAVHMTFNALTVFTAFFS